MMRNISSLFSAAAPLWKTIGVTQSVGDLSRIDKHNKGRDPFRIFYQAPDTWNPQCDDEDVSHKYNPARVCLRGYWTCLIKLFDHYDSSKIIIVSLIDNLLKGASGQAVQCMNIMFGHDEKSGLEKN